MNLLYWKLLSNYTQFIIIVKDGNKMKHIHIRINELLKEKGISKNLICKNLDLPRGNFNRYCRDEFQRIDCNLIIKLCEYFNCEISDLLEIIDDEI